MSENLEVSASGNMGSTKASLSKWAKLPNWTRLVIVGLIVLTLVLAIIGGFRVVDYVTYFLRGDGLKPISSFSADSITLIGVSEGTDEGYTLQIFPTYGDAFINAKGEVHLSIIGEVKSSIGEIKSP